MKRRRLVNTGVLLLLLGGGGAIVNVAVAWGCVVWSPPQYKIQTNFATGQWKLVSWDSFDSKENRWPQSVPVDWPDVPDKSSWEGTFGLTLYTASAGEWSDYVQQTVFDAGLPARSVCAERHGRYSPWFAPSPKRLWESKSWFDGIQVPQGMKRMRMPNVFPTRPIWPGFAINTIFYAAMLWVVFFGPGMMRRRIRRRRGLCPACAYPIGTSQVCTECGNLLKIRTGMGLPPPATPAT